MTKLLQSRWARKRPSADTFTVTVRFDHDRQVWHGAIDGEPFEIAMADVWEPLDQFGLTNAYQRMMHLVTGATGKELLMACYGTSQWMIGLHTYEVRATVWPKLDHLVAGKTVMDKPDKTSD